MAIKRIGFVGYDGATALDLFGPIEVFDTAISRLGRKNASYEVALVSLSGKRFTLDQGIAIEPKYSLAEAMPLDTLIVPGGAGALDPNIARPIAAWISQNASRIRRIVSVCIGAYILGESGLLDGCRATTHWRFVDDFGRKFPNVDLNSDAIFVRDGAIYSSAGVTAGIDLSLSLVQEDFGEELALSVARDLVVYLKRSGGQTQFSEPLQFQTNAGDQFADLAGWIVRNLRNDLSGKVLSKHVGLGLRQFNRRFKSIFGLPPAEFIENLRLDEARRRLHQSAQTMESIARSVGYASGDAFRRAFERRFGIGPMAYRRQFSSP